jgi:hypothetical protein
MVVRPELWCAEKLQGQLRNKHRCRTRIGAVSASALVSALMSTAAPAATKAAAGWVFAPSLGWQALMAINAQQQQQGGYLHQVWAGRHSWLSMRSSSSSRVGICTKSGLAGTHGYQCAAAAAAEASPRPCQGTSRMRTLLVSMWMRSCSKPMNTAHDAASQLLGASRHG